MILVTGSTGLVGRHLLLALTKAGLNVSALYRSENKKHEVEDFFAFAKAESRLQHVSWKKGDITDIPSLEDAFLNIEYVYHCAAYISFDPYEFKKLSKVNIEGTANVVNLCLSNKVKKIVHLSSIATLAKLPNSPITEDNYWDPNALNSVYALTKYGAEMEVWRATEEGLKAVIINPGIILGEGDYTSGSGKFFNHILKNNRFYPKGGSAVIDVKDLVQVMIEAMDVPITQERFIAISQNILYKDLLDAIATALNRKGPKYAIKSYILRVLTFLDLLWGWIVKSRKLTRAGYTSLQTTSHYSNDKIVNRLHFTSRPLSQTLDRIAKHMVTVDSY